jgi:hypothetical protein
MKEPGHVPGSFHFLSIAPIVSRLHAVNPENNPAVPLSRTCRQYAGRRLGAAVLASEAVRVWQPWALLALLLRLRTRGK